MRGRGVVMLLVLLAGLAGCAGPLVRGAVTVVGPDVAGATKVLQASLPLLPPDDPWLTCMTSLSGLGASLAAGPGLDVPGGGLLTEAARLHVLDTVTRNMPPAVKQACGAVVLELVLRAGSRMPGL